MSKYSKIMASIILVAALSIILAAAINNFLMLIEKTI